MLKLSMFGSVLPAADSTGVSTSSTARPAKNSRTRAYRRARSRSAACSDSTRMRSEKFEQTRFVPDVDAEFLGLVEL